jgi:hypothetical protein
MNVNHDEESDHNEFGIMVKDNSSIKYFGASLKKTITE